MLAYEYGKIFRDAIAISNYGKKVLKNIWDLQNMTLVEPTLEYIIPSGNLSFKRRCKINTIWKKYETTENGRISLFSTMERLKLVYATLT